MRHPDEIIHKGKTLTEILRLHKKWRESDPDGARANLGNADLSNADLSNAYLSNSYLSYADLSNAKRHSKKIAKFAYAHGLYEYSVFAFIFDDGSKMIELGCKHQSPEEWKMNFWNNTSQFPDDGSAKTKRRILALRWANDVIKIMEEEK
jgi:uncharacterized protein YjbI with pentapeptide repeats